MKREHFVRIVEAALDSLPGEFRRCISNVAVLVEDVPPNQPSTQSGPQAQPLLGLFHGVPRTKKSTFNLPTGPDYIVLYRKNIKRFAPATPKSANKSAGPWFRNWATISEWMRAN
ncbi:MAG: hypothetical protein DMG70_22110 [Acidobacteria bacterium]|nr:MAG: hypothetical protein DMG70_22110 [Acidobacteriota bacterium]PYY09997.1 MAG: hypothetical protein DMG69_08270 [Acidobacteriota bacterium]